LKKEARDRAVEVLEDHSGLRLDVLLPVLDAPRADGSLGALAAARFRADFAALLRTARDNDFSERRDTTVIQTIVTRRPPHIIDAR